MNQGIKKILSVSFLAILSLGMIFALIGCTSPTYVLKGKSGTVYDVSGYVPDGRISVGCEKLNDGSISLVLDNGDKVSLAGVIPFNEEIAGADVYHETHGLIQLAQDIASATGQGWLGELIGAGGVAIAGIQTINSRKKSKIITEKEANEQKTETILGTLITGTDALLDKFDKEGKGQKAVDFLKELQKNRGVQEDIAALVDKYGTPDKTKTIDEGITVSGVIEQKLVSVSS